MKISYSNAHGDYRKSVEVEAQRHIEKLGRLLKHYAGDTVLLHGALEKIPRTSEFSFSLNLTLPTGALHADGAGSDVRASVKAAFADIEHQVKKHQEKVRKDYVWKRKRGRPAPRLSEIPTTD